MVVLPPSRGWCTQTVPEAGTARRALIARPAAAVPLGWFADADGLVGPRRASQRAGIACAPGCSARPYRRVSIHRAFALRLRRTLTSPRHRFAQSGASDRVPRSAARPGRALPLVPIRLPPKRRRHLEAYARTSKPPSPWPAPGAGRESVLPCYLLRSDGRGCRTGHVCA